MRSASSVGQYGRQRLGFTLEFRALVRARVVIYALCDS